METFTIRKGKRGDLEALQALCRRAVAGMIRQGNPQWDEIYPASAFAGDIEKGELHVICEGEAVAGMVVLNDEEHPTYKTLSWAHEGKILVVHRLVIDPLFQGRKLASRLMDFAEGEALRSGCVSIRLDTFNKNSAAISLYEKRGYRRVGTVFFRMGDFLCFEKRIS